MAKKFSISEGMLNGISKNTRKVEEFQAKENFKIEYINIYRIKTVIIYLINIAFYVKQ